MAGTRGGRQEPKEIIRAAMRRDPELCEALGTVSISPQELKERLGVIKRAMERDRELAGAIEEVFGPMLEEVERIVGQSGSGRGAPPHSL